MGRFFSNLQIRKSASQTQNDFLKNFTTAMKKLGYVKTNSDEAELSYAAAFSPSNQWVTLCSEDYISDNEKVNSDAQKIAANLKTYCISNTVLDSDFAVLDMYIGQEERADRVIIGCGGDYGFESREEAKGNRELWAPIMSDENMWEKFCKVRDSAFAFAEDGLIKVSDFLGISPDLMIADYDEFSSISEDNKAVVSLYFKKAAVKTMSLNAAFIKVFGEALESLGFKRIKERHPYFVRVINEEILHIITYSKEQEKDRFNIYSGVATVYRHELDFSDLNVCCCFIPLKTTGQFYRYDFEFNTATSNMPKPPFQYKIRSIADNKSILDAFSKSLNDVMTYVIPVINKVSTLKECITFFKTHRTLNMWIYSPEQNYGIDSYEGRNSEGLLYFVIDDHSDMTYEMNLNLEFFKKSSANNKNNVRSDYETQYKISNEARIKRIEERDEIYNNKELYEQVMKELNERRTRNTEALKRYEIEII